VFSYNNGIIKSLKKCCGCTVPCKRLWGAHFDEHPYIIGCVSKELDTGMEDETSTARKLLIDEFK
jgi:hypothetical protein